MKKLSAIILLAVACAINASSGEITFTNTSKEAYVETPPSNTGLDAVYVLPSLEGVRMNYRASSSSATVEWQEYGELGGGSATDVSVSKSGVYTTLSPVTPNRGYIITEIGGGEVTRTCVWVVDYSAFRLKLSSLTCDPPSECGTATLNLSGTGSEIYYYTINGVRRILDRGMKLLYLTLEWNSEDNEWVEKEVEQTLNGVQPRIVVPAPLRDTEFSVVGDKFLEMWWGTEEKATTVDTYRTNAIDVRTTAVQHEKKDHDNERNSNVDTGVLGGSAPVTITFSAFCTDAVTFKEWQVASDREFNNLVTQYSQDVVEYTFTDTGTTYWRFHAANSDGSCETWGDPYTVTIGISELYCPNVFSPGSTEGVNDVWRVSYKSIVNFHCWIFNRWGNKIYEYTDPSGGWDGKYKGKYVRAGVYFYVIQAEGSDGKKYKLKGDINILRYKHIDTGGDDEPVESGGGDGGGGTTE